MKSERLAEIQSAITQTRKNITAMGRMTDVEKEAFEIVAPMLNLCEETIAELTRLRKELQAAPHMFSKDIDERCMWVSSYHLVRMPIFHPRHIVLPQ